MILIDAFALKKVTAVPPVVHRKYSFEILIMTENLLAVP